MRSFNNKLILEPYEGEKGLKANVSKGFATVKQKSNLVGLKLLTPALVSTSKGELDLKEGQIIYFEEEILATIGWSRKIYECEDLSVKFIVGDFSHVVMVQ